MTDFSQTDIYTDAALVNDPWAYFEYLREQGPITPLPYRNVVAVTGFEEALAIYADTVNFSSVNAVNGPLPDLPFTHDSDDISAQVIARRPEVPFGSEVVALDAPFHGPMRSLLMPLFTPGRLKAMDAGFRAVAQDLIDEFADSGEVEFIGGYANPLATLIITELLGIPHADRPIFRKYFTGGTAGEVGASHADIAANPLIEMGMRIAGYIAERRAEPRDDLLTQLGLARFPDGSEPSLEQAARVASFLFGAGQDTTVKLLGNSFRLLTERPDLQDILRSDPGRIANFVEEMLRYEGSIRASHRLCQRTTEVGGYRIEAGTTVWIANLAVNRDPRRFPDPASFDMDRPRLKEHLAFGRSSHTCAGAPLARAETRLSVELLLGQLGNIRLDEGRHGPAQARRFTYENSYVLRGLNQLHLRFG
ncbi:MAG: Cytochrome [Novosphingobium sp.]|nr:Cytochrome [Novosphingobium sp.]